MTKKHDILIKKRKQVNHMSYADQVFVTMCKDIIENGTDTQGQKVRPVWEDGTKAYTIKKFGVCNKYNLRKEFPALTLRPTGLKSCMDELLWIWQKKSNNIHDLKTHIWDEWADDAGTIGKAYGYQLAKPYLWNDVTEEGLKNAFPNATFQQGNKRGRVYFVNRQVIPYGKTIVQETVNGTNQIYAIQDAKTNYWYMDQVNKVIYDLINTPFSRRIMTNIYNFADLTEMALYPCAYSMTFNVTQDKETKQLILNSVLNQRSNDILAANNWNVAQYAILTMLLAQICNMVPGEFVHMIADAHIYDRHVPIIKEMIQREQFPAPTVTLNPNIRNFYEFTTDDLIIENYKKNPQIKNIPIAV